MKRKSIVFALLAAPILLSCSSELDVPDSPKQESQSAVEQILKEYCAKSSMTRSNGLPVGDLKIENVETKSYYYDGKETHLLTGETRTAESEGTFEISRADFKSDNGADGYAYVCTTAGAEGVYFFTSNGEISDTTYNGGLRMVLGNIPYSAGSRLIDKDGPTLPTTPTYVSAGPLLKTKWSQKAPYNMHMPYCTCGECLQAGDTIRCKVGCTNVATGQVIAYFGKFKSQTPENSNIDFDAITDSIPNASAINQIAHFLHEIAVRNKSNFGHGSTGASDYYAYNLLLECGYKCDYVTGVAEKERLKQHIYYQKSPCIYVGFRDSSNGHAWVIDGYICSDPEQFHCNWGWGGQSDGWAEYNSMTLPDHYPESYNYNKLNRTIYIQGVTVER